LYNINKDWKKLRQAKREKCEHFWKLKINEARCTESSLIRQVIVNWFDKPFTNTNFNLSKMSFFSLSLSLSLSLSFFLQREKIFDSAIMKSMYIHSIEDCNCFHISFYYQTKINAFISKLKRFVVVMIHLAQKYQLVRSPFVMKL